MQVQSMEDDMVSPVAGENDPTKNYDNDGDPGAVTASKVPDVVIPEVATFGDIMGTAQELRVLVSSRGMDNMLVGSLLTTPSALLPLQDADLSSKPDSEGQKKKGVENDNPNSPECFVSPSTRIRKPAKKGKVTISVDEPSSPKKKMMQVSDIGQMFTMVLLWIQGVRCHCCYGGYNPKFIRSGTRSVVWLAK